MRLRNRAALLGIVINLSVFCTFAACISATHALACTKTCPVRYPKYIEVPDFPKHHYVGPALRELFPFWRYKWLRLNAVPSIFANSFKDGGRRIVVVSGIEHRSLERFVKIVNVPHFFSVQFIDLIVRDYMTRWQIRLLTHWHKVCIDSPPDMFSWSLPDVCYMNGNTNWLPFHEWSVGIVAKFQPRPLIDHNLSLGNQETFLRGSSSIGSSFCCGNHLSVLQINQIGIDNDGAQSERGHKNRYQSVFLFVACVFCVMVNFYALRKMYESGYVWWCLLSIGSLIGLVYCFSLFFQSTF